MLFPLRIDTHQAVACAARLCALLLVTGIAQATPPASSDAPLIPVWNTPEELTRQCDAGLAEMKRRIAALENLPLDTATQEALNAWNDLQIAQEDVESPIYLLNSVSPDEQVRRAADACLIRYNTLGTELFQNAAIHARIRAVRPKDAIDAKLRQDLLDAFEDTGVSLPEVQRLRVKAIHERHERIRQEFERNIRDNPTRLSFTPEEMRGLPASYLDKAKRDEQGNYLLGFAYPEYVPFMENAENEAARERFQKAFVNRGGPRNMELLKEVMQLRHELAGLFGFPSYAHFVTRRRMVGKPEVVHKFLGEVKDAVRELELRDIETLRQAKAERLGTPLAQTRLNRWDVAYYQERVKQQRYAIDQEALRAYFPTPAAIDWIMSVSSQLYGVRFRESPAPVWHPDVRHFELIDQSSGEVLSAIYLDLFPREGKFSHAAAFGVRGVSRLAGRKPATVLVANFNRTGLDANEMETLVHEFGHLMHGALSRTRHVGHAGTSVETDFVEAPSQMYEEWARKPESLKLIRQFCKDCPAVDDAMVARLRAAHNFARGMRYARQHLYASFDMAVYDRQPGDPRETWARMEGDTPLGHIPGTQFPGQFEHIIRGYGAGYYGYMWSEVLALDMLSQFGGNLMNPTVGMRFRKEILERGGERKGAELVRAFLGREPSPQAFFAEIRGQRQ